jgi:oligopeptide transport system permease protein
MENCDLFAPLDLKRKERMLQLEQTSLPIKTYFKNIWERFKTHHFAVLSIWTIVGMVIMATVGPFLSSYAFDETHLALRNQPPNVQFWFGTDELGRDLFTRCWWGARISFFVGLTATLIDCFLGVLYGSIAGFAGGKIDECMMRIADILYTIPFLLVVILLIVFLGPGIKSIIIGLTFTGWVTMARIVRNQMLQLKNLEFVQAAYGLGASHKRILFYHLLPNAFGSIIVTATFTIPSAIFAESFLSFLGLGVQAPIASWGALAYDGLAALRFYPWRVFIPAFLISITILSFNVIGDSLRDSFDRRLTK